MAVMLFAAPILPGKLDAWKNFAKEMQGSRKAAMDAALSDAGVTREVASLQQTPHGDFAVVMFEAEKPGLFMQAMGTGTDEIAQWFRAQLLDVHGMDLTAPPPPPTEIYYQYP